MNKITFSLLSSIAFGVSLVATTLESEIKNSSLVVYNSNIGLVHEERDLSLSTSENSIVYEGVAQSINTDSVNVKLNASVELKSQQFRFDSLSLAKLLQAHIGKKVEVRLLKNANDFKIITATLLSSDSKNSILKTLDYKIITVKNSNIIFSGVPKELITKPSLVWNVEVKEDTKTQLELDYLINNISFKSDYVLNVDENSSSLTGWITLDNRSGKAFTDTNLSLLAGDINRAQRDRPVMYKARRSPQVMSDSLEAKHQAYEGYHFYSIPFKVSLANNEKTQLKFLSQQNIPTARDYTSTLTNPIFLRVQTQSDVDQYVTLSPLETPLPKGVIRTYSKLNEQSILLGESNIKHTPKETPLKLKTGKNFDLKVTQTPLSRDNSKNRYVVNVEYRVKNSSSEDKTIELLIPFSLHEDSKVESERDYKLTKGNLVTFSIFVQANSTESFKVNYKSKR
ncbi:MAG: hypothetical protein U9N39_06390 [Campylobacterota bacterium]|nr:hypothetical protein [Campylobacterota bacterium]